MSARNNEKTKRLFFALWPDDAVRRRIRDAGQATIGPFRCKPVDPQNYHLTLAFLGNIPESGISEIQSTASDIPFQPFELRLDRIASWSRARVAWIGSSEWPEALTTLVDDLWRALEAHAFDPGPRPYEAHVTIARKFLGKVVRDISEQPIDWPVREFVLVSSDTLPEGAVYEILARFPATSE